MLLLLGKYPKTFSGVRNWTSYADTASPFSQPQEPDRGDEVPEDAREIRFDGTPYRASFQDQELILKLFDARGLVQVTTLSDESVRALAGIAGVDENERQIFVDRLRDYLDPDDLTRLSGAEAADYRRAGRTPPANDRFWAPRQLRHVLGWDALDWIWTQDEAAPVMVTCRVVGFNPNTAVPVAVQVTLPSVTPAGVEALLTNRRETPVRNSRELRRVTDTFELLDPLRLNAFPSDCLVGEAVFPDLSLRYRFVINLRRQNAIAPWEFLSFERLPFRDADRAIEQAEDLVLPST